MVVSGPNPVQQRVQDTLLPQSQAAQHARPLQVGEELVRAGEALAPVACTLGWFFSLSLSPSLSPQPILGILRQDWPLAVSRLLSAPSPKRSPCFCLHTPARSLTKCDLGWPLLSSNVSLKPA